MRTISPIYSQNKLEPDINTGKNRAIIFIGAVMAKCNSYVLNYICPPLLVSSHFHSCLISTQFLFSFLQPPLPLLYHCPVGRSDKNTINEREKKQEASRQVAGLHGTLRQLARLYLKIVFKNCI